MGSPSGARIGTVFMRLFMFLRRGWVSIRVGVVPSLSATLSLLRRCLLSASTRVLLRRGTSRRTSSRGWAQLAQGLSSGLPRAYLSSGFCLRSGLLPRFGRWRVCCGVSLFLGLLRGCFRVCSRCLVLLVVVAGAGRFGGELPCSRTCGCMCCRRRPGHQGSLEEDHVV